MCMDCVDNQLWIGDKSGHINLCDTRGGTFDIVDVSIRLSVYLLSLTYQQDQYVNPCKH